jgi:putative endonuclease
MRNTFQPTTYIMANRKNGATNVGVTSNLINRIEQHRTGHFSGFSNENNTRVLVWYEQHMEMESAILREKRIKKWNRQWKINLIEAANPEWQDLAEEMGFPPLPSTRIK